VHLKVLGRAPISIRKGNTETQVLQQHYHVYFFNQEINISYELAYNFKGFHGEMTVR